MRPLAMFFVLIAFATTGCGSAVEDGERIKKKEIYPMKTKLEDGTEVQCLVYKGYRQGGLWCKETAE